MLHLPIEFLKMQQKRHSFTNCDNPTKNQQNHSAQKHVIFYLKKYLFMSIVYIIKNLLSLSPIIREYFFEQK